MTREEALSILEGILADWQRSAKDTDNVACCLKYGFITYGKAKECINILKQESRKNRNIEEIEEVINCDVNAKTKCRMISNILTAYSEEPFINKPCVSSEVCEHDKNKVLDKIRAELIQSIQNGTLKIESGNEELFRILDKYKAESEK